MLDEPQNRSAESSQPIQAVPQPVVKAGNPVSNGLHWIRHHLLDFLNPISHIKRGKADLQLCLQALKNWNFGAIQHDETALATAFRGKLFCTFFLSGPLNFIAPVIGTYAQFASGKNPYVGSNVTIAAANIIGTFGFQVVWYFCNRDLYRKLSFFGRIARVYRDLIPMQAKILKLALAISLLMVILNSLIAYGISLMSPTAAGNTPMGIVATVLDVLLVSAPFIRAMSAIFEQHSHKLAALYVTPLEPGK